MSGVALVLGADAEGPSRAALAACMAMPDRGVSVRLALESPEVALAAATSEWQERLNGGSVGRHGDVVVVADATLYYRDALVQSLSKAGVQPLTYGAGDLIAAAVAAWDDEASNYLEGDFAYVAYRAALHRGHAARDPVGSRPLFHCLTRRGIAIASSPSALVSAGVASAALNLDWLRELCAASVNVGNETAYRDVVALRQGERLRFGAGSVPRTDAWYVPPAFTESGTSSLPFDAAAVELRALIVEAVRERLAPSETTFVSLSGGRDSSAVYAAGRTIAGDKLRSVSLSYPPGDMGREDETIQETLALCGGKPAWIDTEQVPLLGHLAEGLGVRPDAFIHLYEDTSRRLADYVTAAGSRVILNGLGGDTLFHAEYSFLADLTFSGQWRVLAREWKSLGGKPDVRAFFRWAVLPRLGPSARSVITTLRGGRPVHDLWEQPRPTWVPATTDGAQRAWREPLRQMRRGGAADRERRQLLLGPFPGRVVPEYFRISLSRGLEQRSPLYDLRIIQFAATRPRVERQTGGDYKRLLRASMKGLLPPSVTGPRHSPTGFAGSYLRRTAREELPQVFAGFGDTLRTHELGLILAPEYGAEVDRFARSGNHPFTPALLFTALTEAWLRRLP